MTGKKPRAPIQHCRSADAEGGRDVTIRHAVTSHEQDLGAGYDAIGRAFTARPLRQDVADPRGSTAAVQPDCSYPQVYHPPHVSMYFRDIPLVSAE